jgi:ferredoxin--NADP+ reductase
MAQWLEGTVVGRRNWTERLVSLQVEAPIEPYRAGQFIKLGLQIDGEVVGRPYSLVNPPEARPLEFCFGIVPGGPLSGRLAALAAGDGVLVAARANGFLTVEEVPPSRRLWLVATGTGIGPFLSILRCEAPWQRFERIVLVHAARRQGELMYGDVIASVAAARGARFRFVPFVSREPCAFALPGRVPAAIADGSLEARAELAIDEASHFMLCGNPAMVEDVTAALAARGLRKHQRKNPGHISVENYW